MNKNSIYKIGLALSGGGAKGFVHLGVFKALREFGLEPDIIAGTSAGALAGALFADGYEPEEIVDLFVGYEFKQFAEIQMPKSGIFSLTGFRKFLKKYLRAKTFDELNIPLLVIATDLDEGLSVAFDSGPLIEPLLASCSIPIIFDPVVIEGVHYVDGGLLRNFPVTNIRELCDTVIGVNASPLVPKKYNKTLMHIAERSYHYMFRANAMPDRLLCDILIETNEVAQYKVFDLENMHQIFNLGYEAATTVLTKEKNKSIWNVIPER